MQNNLGLRRKTVKLCEYNPVWQVEFNEEQKRIQVLFGNRILGIEHIGSTAIPGIKAKPILDLMIGVPSLEDWQEYGKLLENLGYIFRRDMREAQQHILFVKGPDENRTHYLKLAEFNSDFWEEHIVFRDFLINNPQYAKEYEQLKEKLFVEHAGSREAYTLGKAEFIRRMLDLAGYKGKIL